jgi:hemerythrin-like domain-containing protein
MTSTMNRIIHDAVRRDLDRFAGALASFREPDRTSARRLADAWRFLRTMLTMHHEGEDKILFPAFAELNVDPSLLAALEAEHHAMHDAMDAADVAIGRLAATGAQSEANGAADAIATLNRVTREHLAHEEDVLGPFLDKLRDEPIYRKADRRARRDFGPRQAADFLAWLQYGAPVETTSALRREIPPPVVWAGTVLGRRYKRLASLAWQ